MHAARAGLLPVPETGPLTGVSPRAPINRPARSAIPIGIPPAASGSRHAGRAGAVIASLLLHATMAGAAIFALPGATRMEIESGGRQAEIALVLTGNEDVAASEEGTRALPVSVPVETPPAPPAPEMPPGTFPAGTAPSEPAIAALELPPAPDIPPPDLLPPAAARPESARPRPPEAKPVRREVERPAPKKAEPRRIVERPAPRPAPAAKAEGERGTGDAPTTSRAQVRGGTGGTSIHAGSAAMGSYRARVVAHLTRFKNYPEQAQDRGITGRNAVTITLTRDGRVSASSLAASGNTLLDSATLAALRRAQPFPPIPEGGPAVFTLTISMNYALQ